MYEWCSVWLLSACDLWLSIQVFVHTPDPQWNETIVAGKTHFITGLLCLRRWMFPSLFFFCLFFSFVNPLFKQVYRNSFVPETVSRNQTECNEGKQGTTIINPAPACFPPPPKLNHFSMNRTNTLDHQLFVVFTQSLNFLKIWSSNLSFY